MSHVPKPDPHVALKYFQQKLECTTGPVELSHWIEKDAPIQIVDVRGPKDYARGHIPGAINLPREQWDNPRGLSRDRTNVIYCYSQTCHLAAGAAVKFAKKGYSVIELEGGFNTWKKAKLGIAMPV